MSLHHYLKDIVSEIVIYDEQIEAGTALEVDDYEVGGVQGNKMFGLLVRRELAEDIMSRLGGTEGGDL